MTPINLNLDTALLLKLNSVAVASEFTGKLIDFIGTNPLLRGMPIFLPLAALWFEGESRERRSRMLAGMLAATLATVLSVWLQYHVLIHERPLLDPTLHLHLLEPVESWDRLDSFPSDTGTLFFGLATVVLIENRWAGMLALFWALISVGLCRVVIGFHYPSDVVGALLLGPGMVFCFSRSPWLGARFDDLQTRFGRRGYLLHGLLFIFLADAYSQFHGLNGIEHGALRIASHLLGHSA